MDFGGTGAHTHGMGKLGGKFSDWWAHLGFQQRRLERARIEGSVDAWIRSERAKHRHSV